MGIGLQDATTTFTKAIAMVFTGLQGEEVEIYPDDIIAFAKNLEEYGKRMRRVLQRIIDANLTIEPKNVNF